MLRRLILLLFGLTLLASWALAQDKDPLNHLPNAPDKICPILIGSQVPKAVLKTGEGAPYDLQAALGKKPTILIFYRGGW